MSASPSSQVFLPTLERLNVKSVPENVDAQEVAATWLQSFAEAIASGEVDSVIALILEDGFWRDMLALTWDFRTMHGHSRIRKLLQARLAETKISAIRLAEDHVKAPTVFTAIPGIIWVQGHFDFQTSVGVGSGIFRLVPTPNAQWKAHVVYTNLESLRALTPKVGPLRNHEPNHGRWVDQRAKEVAFEGSDPKVLIIGAGQSGLDVAARLKYLDIPTLVLDKNARIGDMWRDRYQALCLHDPVWYDHLPYLNFPPTWPVWTPAVKLADWLESYAHSLELNVWTSTLAESVKRDEANDEWVVTITRADGSTRVMRPKHVVLAFGLAGNQPNMPDLPGMDIFQGEILHAIAHKTAKNFEGKKVVVVGSATSGHDISQDCYMNGVDVTMVQRESTCVISTKKALPVLFRGLYEEGGPPVEIADRLTASFPNHLLKLIHIIHMKEIAELDKDIIEGLEKAGFKTNTGIDGSGFLYLAYLRGGGYYLDAGASQLVIDGKIKIKNGIVKSFTKDTIVFEDGSSIKTDVVVFASGFGDVLVPARKLLGDELGDKINPVVWGLDEEGEINTAWRDCGLPNFYFMMGNLALCRFHSMHLALQIQAKEHGLYSSPYVD